MRMQICARCKKRPAMVFITRLDNGKSINEGLCLFCAKELGIQPVNDMLRKMGVDDEDMDNILSDIENGLPEFFESEDGDLPDGNIPTLNIGELFGMGDGSDKKRGRGKRGRGKDAPIDESKKNLSTYCTNLNQKAIDGKIDSLIGRDREIDRIIQILCRRQKNNPCLIGEPGVGKTAIAEELAKRIVEGRVPAALTGFEIWMLDLTSLVAGTQFRGQFESRILALLKEIKAAGNIILMIDEVHNIAGAGETSDGSMSAANLLKPALSRGEIRVIGATTLKEYRKHIEKDSALERRFQPVKVEEPSVDETVDIIKGIKKYYEAFHGLRITDDVARAAAILSEKYITDRFLPDKAIDLIDEASSRVALDSPELNEHKQLTARLEKVNKAMAEMEATLEKPEGQTEENYGAIASLKSERMRIETRLGEIDSAVKNLTVTVSDLLKVIEIWTGIPATELSVGDLENLTGLYERLSRHIIGQEKAVSAVVRAVKRKRAGVSYRTNPVSMIFAGPTGVGKTELVRVLAQDLFKQPESLIRLDMSEFMEKHSVSRIIGSPPGYVGYDEAGQLTEKIRRRPYSVVLFDEIEKAHPDVLNILLQILDDGRITDSQGREINFSNTIIVMTTNAGSERSNAVSGFTTDRQVQTEDRVEKALLKFLRPEFINRIDEIITFRHLEIPDFERIAEIMLGKLKDHLVEKGIALTYTAPVLKYIAESSYSEKYGARNMRRFIEKNVEDEIAELLISAYPNPIVGIAMSISEGKIKFNTI
ncbi:MAG: ATP-dependent Clp protease ATP-binding subunit [Clostridia bacterium]|nr:ATP-dependent Clp protease ATP-binding subunit [Clostridia bacterium]